MNHANFNEARWTPTSSCYIITSMISINFMLAYDFNEIFKLHVDRWLLWGSSTS